MTTDIPTPVGLYRDTNFNFSDELGEKIETIPNTSSQIMNSFLKIHFFSFQNSYALIFRHPVDVSELTGVSISQPVTSSRQQSPFAPTWQTSMENLESPVAGSQALA